VYFLFPETGGRSLEEINHIFEGKGQRWSGFTQGVRESTQRPLRREIMDAEGARGLGGKENEAVVMAAEEREEKESATAANVEDVWRKLD
jgi:hypothetical protein